MEFKIKDAISVLMGKKQATDSTIGQQRDVPKGMESFDDVSVKNDRKSIIYDTRDMDLNDSRIELCHRLLSDDASVNGFQISIASSLTERIKNDAKEILDATNDKCKVQTNLSGWIYDMIMEGDLFGELDIDETANEINRIKKLEPTITFDNMNSYGKWDSSKPRYKQTDSYIYENILAEFWDYQIAHTGWKKRDGKTYGTPMFAPARKQYKRLEKAEISLLGMRMLDAGDTIHWTGFSTQKEIVDFKEINADSLANPMKPVNYYYTTGNVLMNKVGGSRNLGQLEDIKHFESLVVMSSGVPMALLPGHDRDINRDILEDQLGKYYSNIRKIDDIMEGWLREIFDTALLLKGITPESLKYTFNWGAKDRDDIDIKIQRALNLQQLGYPFKIIHIMADLDGVEFEDVIDGIKEQIADGVVPYGLNAKLDPNLMALLANIANSQGKGGKLAEDISKLRELAEMQLEPGGDMSGFRR